MSPFPVGIKLNWINIKHKIDKIINSNKQIQIIIIEIKFNLKSYNLNCKFNLLNDWMNDLNEIDKIVIIDFLKKKMENEKIVFYVRFEWWKIVKINNLRVDCEIHFLIYYF